MTEFITAFNEDNGSFKQEIEELCKDFPEALQAKIESAFQTNENNDFATCEKL